MEALASEIKLDNPELYLLTNNKEDGYNYRSRRHPQWTENYTLYRDTVVINRLEQRQSVNVPLMKTIIRTLLKDVDDMPTIYFESIDSDDKSKDGEIFLNEYWKYTLEINKAEIQDIVDKRQDFHYGRTFDQMQVVDGKIKWTVQDTEDMLVSRFMNTHDLNTSRYLIHTHIFTPLSKLALNPDYNKDAIANLQKFYATREGLIKSATNMKTLQDKNQKMSDMGVPDIDSPILGETYVEQTLHFVFKDDAKDSSGALMDPQFFLYVEVDDMEILMKKPLEEVIGTTEDHWWRTHLPYNTWGDDVDHQDFWTDGIADIVRTPNKILNAWFSQMTENRTLRNYNMYFYDNSMDGGNPTNFGNFDPIPFGFYPLNGKPSEVLQRFDIPDLSESLDEMTFLMDLVKNATGATSAQQGAVEQRQVTLGEIKLSLGEAKERVKGMAKFYLPVWKDRGQMFVKLIEAAGDKLDAVKIYKKGKNTNKIYQREIGPNDWKNKSGYLVKVWSEEDKITNDTNLLQKQQAVKTIMPDNAKVDEIYKRKLLSFADYSPEEINQIMEEEKTKFEALKNSQINQVTPGQDNPTPPVTTGQEVPAAIPAEVAQPEIPQNQEMPFEMPSDIAIAPPEPTPVVETKKVTKKKSKVKSKSKKTKSKKK